MSSAMPTLSGQRFPSNTAKAAGKLSTNKPMVARASVLRLRLVLL
jgi:hypothetical protein